MKTLILTKSGGGFMKPILMAGAVVLLSLGATRPALATSAMELVTGTDVIYWDGSTLGCYSGGSSVACSTFGASGGGSGNSLNVSASTFGGWDVTTNSANAYPPSCSSIGTCESQTELNAVDSSASGNLSAYFASAGFTDQGALTLNESGSQSDGTASAMEYAYTGALGIPNTGAAPSLSGQIGSTISETNTGNGAFSAGPTSGLPPVSTPYNITGEISFTPGTPGGGYTMTETISTAVPETSSASVFLVMLLGMAFVVRKRIASKSI